MLVMKRRTLLAGLALSLAGTSHANAAFVLADADRADVARIEAYLTNLHSLKGRFLQVAPNNSVSEGVVWLDRPGRMRFQYDPPNPILLVANYGLVVFDDRNLRQTSTIPLSQTPLGIILADRVKLSGDVTIVGFRRQPGQIIVTLQRTSSPSDGNITLIFSDPPLALQQWIVVDQQRQTTSLKLYNVELGGKFDAALFKVTSPTPMPSGAGGG
jgi:outer membrane lipoprotein-sorting protein